ncbi:MAG: seg [Patescibacteria group bacterium]|nr:seg [Patescibacteria group bacterium]
MATSKHLDILGNLFGGAVRVKLLKFFLLNANEGFSVDDIATRMRIKPNLVKPELNLLSKCGFVKPKIVTKIILGKKKTTRKKANGFIANKDFPLIDPLRNLLVDSGGMQIPDISARFNGAGKITLFITSGIFTHDPDRMMDLMIVGDRLDKKMIDGEIKKIESEIGKELRYAIFDTEEFLYRLKMYDKLIRDLLDYPHTKVVNKISHPELTR